MMNCNRCNIEKSENDFRKHRNVCKECEKEITREYRKKLKELSGEKDSKDSKSDTKICTVCNVEKNNDEYRKNRKVCKDCDNQMAREYRKTLKEKEKKESILCRLCNTEKKNFRINRKICLDCEREHGRNYRQENPEKSKDWNENNKPRLNELSKIRKENNPILKFKVHHTSNLSKFMKDEKKNKKSKFVNCDAFQLREWIKFQFLSDMNFDNHTDVWSIDHVVPCKLATEKLVKQDLILTWINVRPSYVKDNLKKNRHIDKNIIKNHLKNLKCYYIKKELEEDNDYKEYIDLCEKILKDEFVVDYDAKRK